MASLRETQFLLVVCCYMSRWTTFGPQFGISWDDSQIGKLLFTFTEKCSVQTSCGLGKVGQTSGKIIGGGDN